MHGIDMQPIAILGGTFDPIHYGHLRMAQELGAALGVAHVRFIPAGNPAHREEPHANALLRQTMVGLAIEGNPLFRLDPREITRDAPSYTVDTLTDLRTELGIEQPLCLLMGADAFLGLPTWRRWRELFTLAHIVVAHRPGFSAETWRGAMDYELLLEWQQRQTAEVNDLHAEPGGKILAHAMTALDISASDIRSQLESGISPRYLLPDPVLDYIHSNLLYSNLFQGLA